MSGEVGVNNDAFTAAQSALDSSRGEFAGKATSKVASLTAAQTAGKWGVESGPAAARQQYTTALQEIQDAITSLNAEVIAFLSAAGKTQALMGENEQNGIDATQALSEAQLEALDRSLAQAEKEKNSAIAGNSASKVAEAIDIAKVQASDLVGGATLPGWVARTSAEGGAQQPGPVAANNASSSTPQLQLPPTLLSGLGQDSGAWDDLAASALRAPRTPTSGLPTWNSSGGFGRN